MRIWEKSDEISTESEASVFIIGPDDLNNINHNLLVLHERRIIYVLEDVEKFDHLEEDEDINGLKWLDLMNVVKDKCDDSWEVGEIPLWKIALNDVLQEVEKHLVETEHLLVTEERLQNRAQRVHRLVVQLVELKLVHLMNERRGFFGEKLVILTSLPILACWWTPRLQSIA